VYRPSIGETGTPTFRSQRINPANRLAQGWQSGRALVEQWQRTSACQRPPLVSRSWAPRNRQERWRSVVIVMNDGLAFGAVSMFLLDDGRAIGFARLSFLDHGGPIAIIVAVVVG
jgi:hypothetical protein